MALSHVRSLVASLVFAAGFAFSGISLAEEPMTLEQAQAQCQAEADSAGIEDPNERAQYIQECVDSLMGGQG